MFCQIVPELLISFQGSSPQCSILTLRLLNAYRHVQASPSFPRHLETFKNCFSIFETFQVSQTVQDSFTWFLTCSHVCSTNLWLHNYFPTLPKALQAFPNCFKQIQTCPCMCGLFRPFSDIPKCLQYLFKHVTTCPRMSRHPQTCSRHCNFVSYFYGLVHTSHHSPTITDLSSMSSFLNIPKVVSNISGYFE